MTGLRIPGIDPAHPVSARANHGKGAAEAVEIPTC
jgi:hypothetical protein